MGITNTLITRQKKWLVALAALILLGTLFPLWSKHITEAPLDVAIQLAPRGTIERHVEIPLRDNYSLNLNFSRGNIPIEQLRQLIGASRICENLSSCPKGVVVPIRWYLRSDENSEVVASGETESLDASGWSALEVSRYLSSFKVAPGNYSLRVEVLRDVPELSSIPARVSIELTTRASSTWQVGVAWWGTIVCQLIVWPTALLIFVGMLWSALRMRMTTI